MCQAVLGAQVPEAGRPLGWGGGGGAARPLSASREARGLVSKNKGICGVLRISNGRGNPPTPRKSLSLGVGACLLVTGLGLRAWGWVGESLSPLLAAGPVSLNGKMGRGGKEGALLGFLGPQAALAVAPGQLRNT